MKLNDARSDWPNWSNTAFMSLYKIFCGGMILDTKGANNTANTLPQLQAKLEMALAEFPRNLSKLDMSADTPGDKSLTSTNKAFNFMLATRAIEDEPQYHEILQQAHVLTEITTRLVARCKERKSQLASNARVVAFREFIENYKLEPENDIIVLDDFYKAVTQLLVQLTTSIDRLTIWTTVKPTPTTGNNPPGGTSNRGGANTSNSSNRGGKGGKSTKLAATKSQQGKPVGKPKTGTLPSGAAPAKWNCRTCGRQHNCRANGEEGNYPFNLHNHPDRNLTMQPWDLSEGTGVEDQRSRYDPNGRSDVSDT